MIFVRIGTLTFSPHVDSLSREAAMIYLECLWSINDTSKSDQSPRGREPVLPKLPTQSHVEMFISSSASVSAQYALQLTKDYVHNMLLRTSPCSERLQILQVIHQIFNNPVGFCAGLHGKGLHSQPMASGPLTIPGAKRAADHSRTFPLSKGPSHGPDLFPDSKDNLLGFPTRCNWSSL
jgi:hypothetical protein